MSTARQTLPPKLGKYEVRREVGRGGMGVVYEGYDPVINRRVALKTLIGELFCGPSADEYLARLRREAQAAGRLNHPHIVAIYDFGEDIVPGADGAEVRTAFIAMEFIDGRELKSYFDANERFPTAMVVRIMGELLDALEYSHGHGVVHRDIKPANIILLADGSVKVADFGIARIESSTLTQAGTVLGSPSYMSPEQFMGQTVDGRSDLYSAAIILYQLLTGEVPFTGSFQNLMHRVLNEEASPPSVLNVQVPRAFDAVLRRAMAKRPDERYQSAAEFKQAIVAASSAAVGALTAVDQNPNASQETLVEPRARASARPARSRVWHVGLPLAALCLAGVGAAAYFWIEPHPTKKTTVAAAGKPSSAAMPTALETTARANPVPPPAEALPPAGTTIISAVGLADPNDPRSAKETAAVERLWGDARRQLIAKAVALYVEPGSFNANYAVLHNKLLARSDEYISTVLEQAPPQLSKYGLMIGTMRATVKVHDVQRALNQISRDDRIEFIRNNGDPHIAVSIRALGAEQDPAPPQRSAAAENLLKERIRSFGFVTVDDELAKPPADFLVDGEVRFKKLSARLAASGLTIEKYVLTSWSIRAVDARTGEEIYHNTTIPQKKSWASEEIALQEVGRLIGAEFSKGFFLEYFDFGAQKVRLRFTGLPPASSSAVLPEINATLRVLNAGPLKEDGADIVIDTDFSGGGSMSPADLVQQALLDSLNRKLGKTCFTIVGAAAAEVHVLFDASCTSAATLNRLDTLPPEALIDSPLLRIEDVVQDPKQLRRVNL
jgi:predicted Ser/Thr protein kinase